MFLSQVNFALFKGKKMKNWKQETCSNETQCEFHLKSSFETALVLENYNLSIE